MLENGSEPVYKRNLTMDEKYRGRKADMKIDCELGEDGWWTVIVSITQYRSEDLKEWEDTSASIKTIDRDLNTAITNAYVAIFTYGNLFDDEKLVSENKELLN